MYSSNNVKQLALASINYESGYYRNGGAATASIPNQPSDTITIATKGASFRETGYTEWPDGQVDHTGFTATFPTNTKLLFTISSKVWDVDYNSW